MYNKGKIKTYELTLEILTPIHIGTGEKLKKGFDYIVKNGKPFVVNKSATYDLIAEKGKHDDERLFDKNFKIQDIVEIAQKEIGYLLKPISGFKEHEISECIKNAYLKPYIPGSSLKGAIRTALLGTILYNNEDEFKKFFLTNNKNKSFADKFLIKALFGSEPKNDILRAFKVADVLFPANPELVLAEFKVDNIYKSSVQTLYVEAINKGQFGTFSLTWDEFLLSNIDKWNDSNIKNIFPSNYNELCKLINDYSIKYLEKEIQFYNQGQKREIESNLKSLLEKIKADNNDNVSKAYIQMSWGAGWRNKTGNWLEKYLLDIRKQYKLGKGEGFFPRTRRLIIKNQSAQTPGWICISSEPVKIKPQKKSCPWVDDTIDQLCDKHNSKPDDILRGKTLANEWVKISDNEIKKQALEDIINKWKEKGWMDAKPTGSFKKAQKTYGIIS